MKKNPMATVFNSKSFPKITPMNNFCMFHFVHWVQANMKYRQLYDYNKLG